VAKETILVVDDEPHIVELATMYLEQAGYSVASAHEGQEALSRARRLRAESDVAILTLTARSDDVDRIVGLEIGADDYVAKPFNPRELVARAKAILRRYQGSIRPDRAVTAGQLTVDPARREAYFAGQLLHLRPKEFDPLLALAQHHGLILSRARLLDLVWGYDLPGGTRTVDAHISHLRAHLGGSGNLIKTHRGIGYKLVG
jgi:two-component system alkaline phosphatase synthesis response regulator PhoP